MSWLTPKSLSIGTQGTVTTSRMYDGTTAAAKLTDGTLTAGGVVGGDTVTLQLGGTVYNSKDVATASTITGLYTLGGTGAGNYVLASSAFSSRAAAAMAVSCAGVGFGNGKVSKQVVGV